MVDDDARYEEEKAEQERLEEEQAEAEQQAELAAEYRDTEDYPPENLPDPD